MGPVWWERLGRKEECGGSEGGGRKPNPPPGLSRSSYLRAACILDPPFPLASAPPARQGGKPSRVSSFLTPLEGPFHPTQGSCLVLRSSDFSVDGRKRRTRAGDGAPRQESWTRVPLGTCSTFSVEGFPVRAFRLDWGDVTPGPSNLFHLTLSTPPGSWQEVRT